MKKIEGAGSLEDSLLAIGSSDFLPGKTLAAQNSFTIPRLDNDPHVFLGPKQKAVITKQGEKPLLIPDFINLGTYDNSEEEQEIGNNSSGAKIVFCAARGSQNWNKLPFLCGSPQTRELCMNSLERENCLRPLPILQITWLTQSNSRSSSSLILSPQQLRMITNIVNYSASMAFGGGVTPSTFIPGFSINVARCSLPQMQPTHKNFLHALTANRKPPTQLLFAASLIP